MDLRTLHVFCAVAEYGHFGRAGRHVHLTQSGVTRAIRRLEEEVGARLVERKSNGTVLTPAGSAFLPWAQRILGSSARATQAASRAQRGLRPRLVVGVSSTSSLAATPMTSETLDIDMRILASADQHDALVMSRCDVTVSVAPIVKPDVQCIPIGTECYQGLAPEGNQIVSSDPLSFSDWLSQPQVLLSSRREPSLHQVIESVAKQYGVADVPVAVEVDDIKQIFAAVASGVGVAAVPESWAKFRYPGTTALPLATHASLTTYAMFLAGRHDEQVDDFVALARARLAT